MKKYYKLIVCVLIFGFTALNMNTVSAQGQCFTGGCTGGTSYGSAQSTTSSTFVPAMSCTYGGEYNTFNVTSGSTYEWSLCPSDGATAAFADDQLTLRTTAGVQLCYSDDYCDGAHAKISWTATFTGQVQVLVTQYYCSFTASCNTMMWRMSSSAPVGCTNGTSYGSATINPTGTLTTISTCSYGGEYSTISGAVAGQSLQFTMGAAGGGTYITIHSGTYNGPVLAQGASPLTFTNTYTGTLYAHWNTNASCGTYFGCLTTTVQCMSCAPPTGCTNATSYGAATINTAGTLVTISTCSYGGEYSTISGAVAGQSLQFTMAATGGGTYITIHSGSYNGPVLAYGTSPLTFTNTYTGTLYAHWNTNAACGTYFGCLTTTVQCMSCGGPTGCTNTTSYGAATINTSGTLVTVSTCSYGGEYSTISGAVAGQSLQFTMGSAGGGTWITVHSGTYNGAILAAGASPLTFANTYTGTIYAHWNTNSSCGTYFGCLTTTVQCMSCSVPTGCTNTTSYGAGTIDPSGSLVTISTCSYGGEYSTVSGAVAGQSLQFTMGSGGGGTYITIHSGTYNGPVLAFGASPLTFTNTYTGTLYAHWNTNASCGTYFGCLTTTVQCMNCAPTGCQFTSSFGSATIPTDNSVVTISTCSYAGEYSTVFSAVSGTTLRFTSGTTDYITVRSGSYNGPIIGQGASPLQFTNTYTGTVYPHWSTNSACGTQFSCRTTTVQCFSCAPPAAPNDLCAGAITLACGGTITGNTTGAGFDANSCGGTSSPGLWYKITPAVASTVTVSLCGSAYDTRLSIYDGSCGGAMVACNDDFCGLQSQVSFAGTGGTTYYILVNGYTTNFGAFTLSSTCVAAAPPPANDQCTSVVPVPLTLGTPYTFTGNTVGVTNTNDGAFSAYPTVWHAITLPGCASIELNYCSTSPAFGNVWLNLGLDCPNSLFTAQGNYAYCGNGSGNFTVSFTNLPAGNYWIPIIGQGNDPGYIVTPGPYTLTVNSIACPPPPVNDVCSGAIDLPCGTSISGNTLTGGYTPDIEACGGAGSFGAWYKITPTVGSIVSLSLCGSGYDTRLGVYTGTCGSLSLISGACNDDFCGLQSQVDNLAMTAGTTYYILVNGYATGSNGAFTLAATCIPSECTGSPNPGSTLSSGTNPVCGAFTLSFSGAVAGLNLTYQWESSANGTSGWTAISGATNATYTTGQPATTWYRCVVTCPSNPPGISTPLEVVSNPNFMACYCNPVTSCTFPDIISNVTFATINRSSTCDQPSGGYSVYTSPNPAVLMGVSTPLSVTTSGDVEGIAVWIDYDHSGSFEVSENIYHAYVGTNPHLYTTNVIAPTSAQAGQTMMRIRCMYANDPVVVYPATASCEPWTYGETEDYWVQLIPPNATSNSPVCEGDTLRVFSPSTGTSYTWSTTAGNGFTSTDQNPFIPNSNPGDNGTYTVLVNTGSGSYTASVTVVVNPQPSVSTTADPAFCEGTEDLNLTSSAPTATGYAWTGPNSYTSSDPNPVRTGTTANMTGVYTLVVTDANGCTNTSTENVTIYALPPTDIVVIGSTHVCTGQTSTDLQAIGADWVGGTNGYSWTTGSTFDLITVNTQGVYTVTGTDGNGCIQTSTVTITESAPPAPPVVTPAGPINLCSFDGGNNYNTVTLSSSPYTTDLLWSTGETTPTINVNYVDVFFSVYTDPLGCYGVSNSVTVNGYLASEAPTTITSNAPGNTLCGGGTVTLTVTDGFLGDAANWVWYLGGCGSGASIGSGNPLVIAAPATPGTYNYYARAEGECNTTGCATIAVTVKEYSLDPTSASASSATICSGDLTNLSVTGGFLGTGAQWVWRSGSCGGALVGYGQTISVSTASTTTYYVRAEGDCNNSNCVSTTVTVRTPSTAPTSATASTTQTCTGGSVNLSVVGGSLGTGASWVWYEDVCGTGPSVGTGANITVSPTSTGVHNYYVRAEGPCNTTSCVGVGVSVAISSVAATSATTNVVANSICLGNTITLTANGGLLGTGGVWKWYAGGCASGASVGTGASITITPTATTTYYVRAEGLCNNTSCASVSVTVSTGAPIGPPPTITSAPVAICSGNGSTITAHSVTNATYYVWSAPNGTTFDGGNPSPYTTTTNSVSVTFGTLPSGVSGYDICVFAGNGCGTTVTKCRYIRGRVVQPQIISGSSNPCPNTSGTYSITAQQGADSYTWTITGAANINGVGTTVTTTSTSVTVNFLPGWTSGTLSVYASMNCGYNSPARTINIVSTPPVPGAISGSSTVCPLQSSSFSIAPVSGATSYIWSTSVGGSTITGGSTANASILFGSSIPAGSTVSVIAVGTCGNSAPRVKTIGTGVANAPGTISGDNIGMCGQSGAAYDILPVGGATSYQWTVTAGAAISGPSNLSGVSVNFSNSFSTVTLSVIAVNSCGNSAPSSMTISGAPGTLPVINGPSLVCPETADNFFDVNPGTTGASSYTWSVPSGSFILNGQTTPSVQIYFGTTSGNVTVYAENTCGVSPTRTLPVTVTSAACRVSQVLTGIGEVSLYPNPTDAYTTLKFESATAGTWQMSVQDAMGRIVVGESVQVSEGTNMLEIDLSKVAKGVYLIRMEKDGETSQLQKISVQ